MTVRARAIVMLKPAEKTQASQRSGLILGRGKSREEYWRKAPIGDTILMDQGN